MQRKSSGVTMEKTTKVVKKIPETDNGPAVHCKTKSGQLFEISQNREKMRFALWRVIDGGFAKIATANNPLDLKDLIPWDQ